MFDIWLGDVNLTVLILIVSLVIVLPVQLLLCFKVKPLALRLLPVIALSLCAVLWVAMSGASTGWDGLSFLVLAGYAAFMLLVCGIGWGIWAVVDRRKKKG